MRSLLLIALFAVLSSCNGQTNHRRQTASKTDSITSTRLANSIKTTDGIVYFSTDNGLTWESKSEGLPATVSLELGAIAVSDNSLGLSTKENGVYLFDFQKNSWVSIPTDKQIIENNPGALAFYKDHIYVGTQFGGVFFSADKGNSWTKLNSGLSNLTIRKLAQIDNKIYAGTDAGFYSYNELQHTWELEYGNPTLQVNGITELDGSIYIGTNQGAFTTSKYWENWKQIFTNRSLHNISSDDKTIYAMVYNELFASLDKGASWQSLQKGLPAQLYTFNVVKNGDFIFAGQWDGIYRKEKTNEAWQLYSNGLPDKLAITNMIVYKGMIIISGNERKLKKGMTTGK